MNTAIEPLSELLSKFLQDLKSKDRSPSTILAYGSDLGQLIEFLSSRGKTNISEFRSIDLEGFRDHLLATKYTPKSTSRKLNAVKTFFRWLKDEGYLEYDHSKDVSHPKIASPEPKFLSPIEYRSLRDVAKTDTRVSAILEIILQTGMRISEVANMKTTDVTAKEIKVEAYASQSERRIPLNALAKEAIENYLRERQNTEYPHLFVSKNGRPLAVRNIRAMLDRYMQRAGLSEYSVNDLRNTFIVENLKRGVDLVTISQTVGHKRVSTTERYLNYAGLKESGLKQKLEEL